MVVKDLKEQPESKYILLVGAGQPSYYAVDYYEVVDGAVITFFMGDEMVYTCRVEGTWALVHRNAVRVTNDKELTAFQLEDAKVTEAFYEKLDPEGWKESKKIAMSSLGLEMPKEADGKPVPGQYI